MLMNWTMSLDAGGARRNRTDDLFNAIEALSQLSYGPVLQMCRASIGAKRTLLSEGGGITANLRRPQGPRAKKAAIRAGPSAPGPESHAPLRFPRRGRYR